MRPVIRILEASSIDPLEILLKRIEELKNLGFDVRWEPMEKDQFLPFLAGSRQERAERLWEALTEPGPSVILCARGGYGASDLLDDIPWTELKDYPPKTLIGFSDACALMAPLVFLAHWPALHGPMPASKLWPNEGQEAIDRLLAIMKKSSLFAEPMIRQQLALTPLLDHDASTSLSGQIFGGCFSVLTNLLATRFFPAFEGPTILFWEDVGENPGRLIRMLNQWKQVGQLKNVCGIILGDFSQMDTSMSSIEVKNELARRLHPIPCWSSDQIGHCVGNMPVPLGVKGQILENNLLFFQ